MYHRTRRGTFFERSHFMLQSAFSSCDQCNWNCLCSRMRLRTGARTACTCVWKAKSDSVFFKGNFLQSRLNDESPSFRPPRTDRLSGTPMMAWRTRNCPEIVSNVVPCGVGKRLREKRCSERGEDHVSSTIRHCAHSVGLRRKLSS